MHVARQVALQVARGFIGQFDAALPRTAVNATTGWIVDATGWFAFFLLCAVLALPGMALLLRVAPWNGGHERGTRP